MDASDNAGIEAVRTQCIRDAYLLGRCLNTDQPFSVRTTQLASFSNLSPKAVARLAEAISDGDPTVTGSLLRGWGIR